MVKAFEVSNIVMHIILISVFIIVFFFTYGIYLEKQVLKRQLEYMIDDSLDNLILVFPDATKNIKATIDKTQTILAQTNSNINRITNNTTDYILNSLDNKQMPEEKINAIRQQTTKINNAITDTTENIVKSVNNTLVKFKNYKYIPNEELDKKVEESNKKVFNKALIALSIGLVAGIIIIYILTKKLDMEGMSNKEFIIKLLKKNGIVLAFIAVTEFIFAYFFAQNIMYIDVNLIKKAVVENLIKMRDSN
jgi:hypothetical protein